MTMLENVRNSNLRQIRWLSVYQSSNASSTDISLRSVAVLARTAGSGWSTTTASSEIMSSSAQELMSICGSIANASFCSWASPQIGGPLSNIGKIPSPVDLAACPNTRSRCMLSAPALLPVISTSSSSGWKPINDAYREASRPLIGFDGNYFGRLSKSSRSLLRIKPKSSRESASGAG